ncbi:unnamed protein product [Spirodela intermedia]|uniref:Uncharacterized protein n=2 Tax=Spirodela intermedia TaxID=51605 RepID=A0A7I8KU50_SPIIN|nr:unnamed protein product [Spirodela intermedia]CAA6664581.1 unnamed protein product [Spirodela intermedia]CAA7401171.1 unnamed protein product [Spirodela intermedia]
MAINVCLGHAVFPRSQAEKATTGVPLIGNGQMNPRRQASNLLSSRAATKVKVFEDRAAGIVCYKDENGEVICEGYDEGPRYSRHSSPERDRRQRDVRDPPGFPEPRWTASNGGPRVLRINGFAAAQEADKH